ncbi:MULTISPECIES: hypothetical protein [unclassified Duganella]|uniref:hypothetical protein n=1 Tax=unclassified Duganella TaxID=2636909 RepID=UPI0006FD5D81|nr:MULTISPECIES: hypothetical protein [unclassified Duganella]KQV49120.1 hypothetical protein ASD07_29805 [Duganella sp. Root336D2]KRB99064.1 hypothetical protein ASE26_24140 [Duganella sp. Root198D2]
MENLEKISLTQARAIAQKNAYLSLKAYCESPEETLKTEYLEGDHCWMFFRSEKICVPENNTLGIKWAFVVSKKGKYSMVQDFSDDKQRVREYLKTMSDYFFRRGE